MKMIKQMCMALALVCAMQATAQITVHEFKNPEDESRYRALIEELRCPKCQNQNLAGSDAPIAQDLKQKTYEMIQDGRSDTEIRNYMFERYGDFISYKPPVRPSTWILWFFPPVLLVLLVLGWVYKVRTKKAVVANDGERLSVSEEQRLQDILDKHNKSLK